MKNTATKSMFDAIKQSLTTSDQAQGAVLYKEILRFTAGNTYQVRLLPNPNSPKETIFHYYNHAWNSNSTGKFIMTMCPSTFGETCPIDAHYLKTYRTGSESEKSTTAPLSRKENWMVNVYVISDPVNPENEGTVKILRYGKELAKIIQSAIDGDDSEEFGVERVFDVANGSTLRIKCESRTGDRRGSSKQFITYASSKFLTPSSLDLTKTQIDELYESLHDLKAVNKQTTAPEMQRLLDEHFFNLTTGSEEDSDLETSSDSNFEVEKSSFSSNLSQDETEEVDSSADDKIKKILADL